MTWKFPKFALAMNDETETIKNKVAESGLDDY